MGKLSYCLMELADGGNLRDLINSEISVPFSIYSAQIRGLSSALECLHGKNILHRDIKPENILIKGERWLLSDFGLTAPFVRDDQIDLTRHDEKIGPKFWLSPEATNKALGIHGVHSELGKHSDVFQLASVFWYVVNKRHPLGVVGSDDWTGKNEIYEVLYGALLHNPATRIADGSAFHQRIVDAIEA
jgi:serine/threonine protein kinase